MQRRRKLKTPKRRTPIGAPPGTLIPDPNSVAPTISLFGYDQDRLIEKSFSAVDEITEADCAHKVTWVNVDGLADILTIQRLGERFGLHSLALEDVVNVHQRPKVEEFDDHLFIVTRAFNEQHHSVAEQVSVFLGKDFVLTFQERPGGAFDPVRDQLRRANGRIREFAADYLTYVLLDAVTDGFFPALETTGESIAHLEDRVVMRVDARAMSDIHDMKRDLLDLRRAIWPQREMFNALIRSETGFIASETKIYLRDCYDHTIQLIDMVETYREIASGLVDIYLSSLSNRMNEIMKLLTMIATIFIPLGFIAGLYGMNFDRSFPWNMPELGWRYGYLMALGLMIAVAVSLLVYFKRKGWLRASS